jgi:hypothetical protein
MWKRLRRTTFGPRQPLVRADQWGLVLVTLIALVVSAIFLLKAF